MFNRKERYYFWMKEEDVTKFLTTVNKGDDYCTWSKSDLKITTKEYPEEGKTAYLVSLKLDKTQYEQIMIELCKIGTIRIDEADSRYFVMK